MGFGLSLRRRFFGNGGANNAAANGANKAKTAAAGLADDKPLQTQLKSHLNGLYSGLTKLVSTSTPSEGEEQNDVTQSCANNDNKAPFSVQKAIHNIMFIKHHMKRQDEFDAEDQDWGIVAMVLDRLFLWVFGITASVGSLMILSGSPHIYDKAAPIDVVYSKIAQEESKWFEGEVFV